MASIPLRNRIRSLVGSIFRRPLIKAKDRFLQTARTSCAETQQATLQRLLRLNDGSQFARDHGLRSNLSSAELRDRIPVTDYETFRPYIDKMQTGDHAALLGEQNQLLMYAITSGTTQEAKLIPITRQFVTDNRRGWQHWGNAAQQHPGTLRQLRMVQVISNHNRWRTPDGTPCGNISGLVTTMQKAIVRKLYTIPAAVAAIDDPDAKRYAVARFGYADPWVGMLVTANPSTLLSLTQFASENAEALIRDLRDGTITADAIPDTVRVQLQRLLKPNPSRAAQLERVVHECGNLSAQQCWPHLAVLGVWTGGSAGAYLPELYRTFGKVPVRDHGLHASEGRMTIPFEDDSPVGLLDIDSHYFEFVPVDEADSERPVVLEAHELEVDTDYLILLTTSSGFYRYNIQDVVRCRGFHGSTPLLEFLHKGAHISSITGEKITESQVLEAVKHASASLGVVLQQFTLTPTWAEPPRYRLYMKCEYSTLSTSDLQRFSAVADAELRTRNCEYDEKRGTNRLAELQCEVLPAEVWATFANARLTSSGGSIEQYKHPCLLPDAKFEELFLRDAGWRR